MLEFFRTTTAGIFLVTDIFVCISRQLSCLKEEGNVLDDLLREGLFCVLCHSKMMLCCLS